MALALELLLIRYVAGCPTNVRANPDVRVPPGVQHMPPGVQHIQHRRPRTPHLWVRDPLLVCRGRLSPAHLTTMASSSMSNSQGSRGSLE